MLTLVIGGSASGKSAYAEKLALSLPGEHPGIYLATMEPFGREAQERIERHRTMRKNRGFLTVECARNLRQAPLPPGGSVLLEDLGNLVANELFGDAGDAQEKTAMEADRSVDRAPACGNASRYSRKTGKSGRIRETGAGFENAGESALICRILEDIEYVRRISAHLTVVTNEVFSAGQRYEGDTHSYLRVLACVNRALAERADQVAEVVCGIPVFLFRKSGLESPAAPVFPGGRGNKTCRLYRETESTNRLFDKMEEAGQRAAGQCETKKDEKGDRIMRFVTGPLYAGKQAYVMQALGWQEADFAQNAVRDVQELAAEAVRAVRGVQEPAEQAGREAQTQESLPDTLPSGPGTETALEARLRILADTLARKQVVIATEVGGGIVPLDPLERQEREAAGRLACLLAARAQTVIRVNCGLPQVLKGPADFF